MHRSIKSGVEMMNVLIIEDSLIFQKELENMLNEIEPSIVVLKKIKSVRQAIEWFNENHNPDLIFLDIQLTDGNCFEIFEKTKVKSPVIFTTAYNEYAIKAFELNSIDYLLKPINKEKLSKSIVKYKTLNSNLSEEDIHHRLKNALLRIKKDSSLYKQRLLVYKGKQLIPVSTANIAYVYSEDKISFIVTKDNNRYIVNTSLDDLENNLDPDEFFRANRQFIVAIHSIKQVMTDFNYRLRVEITPPSEKKIIVSREKSKSLKEWLNK